MKKSPSAKKSATKKAVPKKAVAAVARDCDSVLSGVVELLQEARRASARTVNAIMTATYWEVGRRIVEHEQGGDRRAGYGEELLKRLSADLTPRLGRGFGVVQVSLMRQFYLASAVGPIFQSLIEKSESEPRKIRQSVIDESATDLVPLGNLAILQSPIEKSGSLLGRLKSIADAFPLSWTHYVRLLRVRNPLGREFYHAEALRCGWSVRQLERQIGSQFYERAALSRNKMAMLKKSGHRQPEDIVTAEEEIKQPLVLEFLGLKDEYSESELEEALIRHLETFLLELGGGFTFVGRQKRLRIDHEWFRIDLLFYHRRLRSLVVIDLKTGPLDHADIGQMHLYLNYAREHWMEPGENPPVGLILCTEHGDSLARYALEGLPNPTLVREYRLLLPDEKLLADELTRTRRLLEARLAARTTRRKT